MPTTDLTAPVILGAGPVGRTIAQRLVAAGHQPRVLTKPGTAIPGTKPVAVDLTNVEATTEAAVGADVLFHCAQPAYHRQRRLSFAVPAGGLFNENTWMRCLIASTARSTPSCH